MAFNTTQFFELEQWSNEVWVGVLQDMYSASRVKGILVNLDGVTLEAMHLPHDPPRLFICDFTGIDVDQAEVSRGVRQALTPYPGRPTVRLLQASPKLYAGRYFLVEVPRAVELACFYVPMKLDRSNGGFMACFKPLDPSADCALCKEPHAYPCGYAKEIRCA